MGKIVTNIYPLITEALRNPGLLGINNILAETRKSLNLSGFNKRFTISPMHAWLDLGDERMIGWLSDAAITTLSALACVEGGLTTETRQETSLPCCVAEFKVSMWN